MGTAILIAVNAVAISFIAGVSIWWFVLGVVIIIASIPVLWVLVLHSYQKQRIITFLNPESDPAGAGYHILQSKVAIGSGGLNGLGYRHGTQSSLDFLPEKHTDFIFSVVAEEFGFIGAFIVLLLVFCIVFRVLLVALNSASKYGKFVAMGVAINFFLYVMINVGMVMGIFPIVGVPFPLLSYGGTVVVSIMISFGFVHNVKIHEKLTDKELQIDRYSK